MPYKKIQFLLTHLLTLASRGMPPRQEDVLCLVGGKRSLPATKILFVSNWQMPRGDDEDGSRRLVAVEGLVAVAPSVLD